MTDTPKESDPKLPCHGCAHSAARAPFPGYPSGERPCAFCIRNPEGQMWSKEEAKWYDGKTPPFKYPMDCYISTDRLTQEHVFDVLDDPLRMEEITPRGDGYEFYRDTGMPEDELTAAIKDGAPACCEGGPVKGHDYTCIFVLGIRYG